MISRMSFLGFPLRTTAQRRLLVCLYYGLLLTLTLVGLARQRRLPFSLMLQTVIFGGMLGGIRAGGPVKAYSEPVFDEDSDRDARPIQLGLNAVRDRVARPRYWTPLDERETAVRDHAHFVAYRMLLWVAGVSAVAYWCTWQWAPAMLGSQAPLLVWLLLLVALSLPQGVLLWTEPGAADPEGHEHLRSA